MAEEPTVTFSIAMPQSLRDRLNATAESLGESRASFIRRHITEAIEEEEAINSLREVLFKALDTRPEVERTP